MSTPFIIQVPAVKWDAYQKAKARASAAKREAEQLGEQCGIPDADALAKLMRLRYGIEKGEAVIQDGNGSPIGKVSVFYHPGATIPAGWRKRES